MRSRSLSADISYSPAIQDSQHGYLYARVFDNRASQLFNCLPHLLQSWSSHLTFCNRSPPSFLSCECCCILICLPAFRQQKSRNDSLIFLASVVSCEPVSFLLWKEIIKFSKIKTSGISLTGRSDTAGTISKESIRFSVIKKSRYIHCSEFDSFLLYQIAINFLIISL